MTNDFSLYEMGIVCRDARREGYAKAVEDIRDHLYELERKAEGAAYDVVADLIDWINILEWEQETG